MADKEEKAEGQMSPTALEPETEHQPEQQGGSSIRTLLQNIENLQGLV